MQLFKKKPKGYLGIDFGAGGIKLIQLSPGDGRGSLFTYGFVERGPEELDIDYLEKPEEAGALLKKVCEKARVTTISAVTALPIPSVFSAVLSLAFVPKKELAQAVQWEAKKLIPLPLEEVALDFKVLTFDKGSKKEEPPKKDASHKDAQKEEKKSIEVLLTAAPKGIIDKYIAIAKTAGLTLSSLETEAFALIRALLGSDPTPSVIVDIGAMRSNILMVDWGIPMFTRSVEIGGRKCTEAIAASMGIGLAQAEAMKRDFGASSLTSNPSGTLPPVLVEVLTPLLNELRYSFNVYKTRNHVARPPERIVLTGGGAGMPGLTEFLAAEFNIRAFVGNPWEHVKFHPDLTPSLQTFGSKFSVAIGLALRNL